MEVEVRSLAIAIFFVFAFVGVGVSQDMEGLRIYQSAVANCGADDVICVDADDRRPLVVLFAPGEKATVYKTAPDSDILGAYVIVGRIPGTVNMARTANTQSITNLFNPDPSCSLKQDRTRCLNRSGMKQFLILFLEKTDFLSEDETFGTTPGIIFTYVDEDHDEFALPDEPAPRSSAFSEFMDNFYDK